MKTISVRQPAVSTSRPPRLRLAATLSHAMLLDGGWWPRSTDPLAEFPGLILALDSVLASRGPVTHVMLGMAGWDSRPRRLLLSGRILRIGWFNSQPAGLLTATCGNGDRIDLLVVPSGAEAAPAAAAMAAAADAGNHVHAPDLLRTVAVRQGEGDLLASGRVGRSGISLGASEPAAQAVWETEGGSHLAQDEPSTVLGRPNKRRERA